MKLLSIFYTILLIGCAEITHVDGELPKVKLVGAEEYCTEELRAKVEMDEFLITCTMRL